jgi:hypothetical protein
LTKYKPNPEVPPQTMACFSAQYEELTMRNKWKREWNDRTNKVDGTMLAKVYHSDGKFKLPKGP